MKNRYLLYANIEVNQYTLEICLQSHMEPDVKLLLKRK